MENQQTQTTPAVVAPRRRRTEDERHRGDLVNHVLNLQHVARCVEMAMAHGLASASCQGAVEHLADELDQLADRLAGMEIRPALRGVA